MRDRLVVATRSAHKLRELRELLDLRETELVSLDELRVPGDPVEDRVTFEGNAAKKARWAVRATHLPALADDSGLEVDALGGRPGVWTRRYAGPTATDEENNALLLSELDGMGVAPPDRTARYRCVLVLAEREVVLETTHGTFEGRIALAPRGSGGFGYDPIFEPESETVGGRTVGELSPAEKNAISHRAQAARALRERLIYRGY